MISGGSRYWAFLVIVSLARSASSADIPAVRPDGETPGAGSQRYGVEAVQRAHLVFNADACVAAIDATLFRTLDPKRPAEDLFDFILRSPSLSKMRYSAKICLPHGPGAAPQCSGEWQYQQERTVDPVRCLTSRPIDTAEALLSAKKHGLAAAPVDGMRLYLREVGKKGRGRPQVPKLRGKTVWIIESRGQCHAVDAKTAEYILKASCKALGFAE